MRGYSCCHSSWRRAQVGKASLEGLLIRKFTQRRLLARAENEKQTPPSPSSAARAARLEAERVEKLRRRDLERGAVIRREKRRAIEKRAEFARARSYSGVSSPRTPATAEDAPIKRWR